MLHLFVATALSAPPDTLAGITVGNLFAEPAITCEKGKGD